MIEKIKESINLLINLSFGIILFLFGRSMGPLSLGKIAFITVGVLLVIKGLLRIPKIIKKKVKDSSLKLT